MSAADRVIRNTMFLYIRMLVSILVSVFTTRILLQALGASDYGLYNVVAGALSMLGFLSSSLSTATQRFISFAEGEGHAERIRGIISTSVLLHWILAAAVCLLFVAAGFLFFNGVLTIPEGRTATAIIVYGCLIFSTVFSITVVPYEAVLTAHENMLFYSLLGIADVFLKLLIAIGLTYSSFDRLLLYGALMALEAWAVRYVTQLCCQRKYEECQHLQFRKGADKQTMKEMATFAGWNTLNIATGMFSLYGMNILINHFFGTLLNAAMGIANQLSGVLMGVSANMTKALTPVLVKKEGARDRQQVLEISYLGCKYSYLLFSFFCIPILFEMPFILNLWLQDVPEWTVLFSRLMIVSCLIEQLFVFLYQSIQAQGEVKAYNIARSVSNILPILITTFQYHYGWDPQWVIINWIIFKVVVGGIINLYYAWRNLSLSIRKWLRLVLRPALLTIVPSLALSEFLMSFSVDGIILRLFRMFSMFVLSLPFYWIFAIGREEKQQLKRLSHRLE